MTILGEKRSHLLRHVKLPAHEMQEAMLGSLQSEENGISHVLNLNLKAALLEPSVSSTSLLAFLLSLLPEWAAHEELTFCHSLHLQSSPSQGNSATDSSQALQPAKAPGLSLCVMGARGWTDGPSVPLIATLQIPFWTRLQHPAMGIF